MTTLISIKEASKYLGVHPQTLRKWDRENKLKPASYTANSNQRRYSVQDLDKFKNDNYKTRKENGKLLVLYARVSSKKQEEDLERQIEYLKRLHPDYDLIIQDISSGINLRRQGIQSILRLISENKMGCLVVAFKDRLCRQGFELWEMLSKLFHFELIVVNKNKDSTPESELTEDLIAIITSYSARLHGLRKYRKSEEVEKKDKPKNRERSGSY